MDAAESGDNVESVSSAERRTKKKKKKKSRPSSIDFDSIVNGSELAQAFKQKEQEWARMCFVQQLKEQQQHNELIRDAKTKWKQERQVRVEMHKKVVAEKQDLQKKCDNLEAECDKVVAAKEDLQKKCDNLEAECDRYKDTNGDLSKKNDTFKARNDELLSQLMTAQRDNTDLSKEKNKFQAENAELHKQLINSERETQRMEHKKLMVEGTLQQTEQQLQNLKLKLESLSDEAAQYQAKAAKILEMEQAEKMTQNELQSLRSKIVSFESQLTNKEKMIEELLTVQQELVSKNELILKEKHEALEEARQGRLDSETELIEKLESEKRSMTEENLKLRQRNEDLLQELEKSCDGGGELAVYNSSPYILQFDPKQYYQRNNTGRVDFELLGKKIKQIEILENQIHKLRKEYEQFRNESHTREMTMVFVSQGLAKSLAMKLVKKGIHNIEDLESLDDEEMANELDLTFGDRLSLKRAIKNFRKNKETIVVHGNHVAFSTGSASPVSTKHNNVIHQFDDEIEVDDLN